MSLKLKNGLYAKNEQHCGGAIISSRLILTAAHCIDVLREDEYFVTVGEEDVNKIDEAQIFEVEKHIIQPKYNSEYISKIIFLIEWTLIDISFTVKTKENDIALVKLRLVNGKGINFDDNAQPICLPSSEAPYKPDTLCHVSGWGQTKCTKILSFIFKKFFKFIC